MRNISGRALSIFTPWRKYGKGLTFLLITYIIKKNKELVFYTKNLGGEMKNAKILLVDSRENSRFLITHFLHKNGFDDIFVVDKDINTDLIDQCKKLSPALLLLDVQIPEVDILELIKKIRNLKNTPQIIALSTNPSIEHQKDCIKSGANKVLLKPFDSQDLIKKVKCCLVKT